MLSYRMKQIAECVTAGNRLADIGTDHAWIPIYLVEQGVVPQAVALDVGEGPLNRARENIKKHGLSGHIECRLSDGFDKLSEQEIDSVIIAGMGGALMTHILERAGDAFAGSKELILQPQSEIHKVRSVLHQLQYRIVEERFFKDDGKYYHIIKALPGKEHYSKDWQYQYGVYLPNTGNECFRQFLLERQLKLSTIKERIALEEAKGIAQKTRNRLLSIDRELKELKQCLDCYDEKLLDDNGRVVRKDSEEKIR